MEGRMTGLLFNKFRYLEISCRANFYSYTLLSQLQANLRWHFPKQLTDTKKIPVILPPIDMYTSKGQRFYYKKILNESISIHPETIHETVIQKRSITHDPDFSITWDHFHWKVSFVSCKFTILANSLGLFSRKS